MATRDKKRNNISCTSKFFDSILSLRMFPLSLHSNIQTQQNLELIHDSDTSDMIQNDLYTL